MSTKTSLLILLLSLMITLSSCQGQVRSDYNEKNSGSKELGEKVSEIGNYIWSVYQDQNENYWFGSNGNGVFFYDGMDLRRYSTLDGLVDDQIRGIQGDHLGNVFIQTPSGVSMYNGKTFTTLKPIISTENEWALELTDLWFNCNGNPDDLYRYDGENLYELALPRKDLNEAFGTKVRGLSFQSMNSSPYSVFGIDKDKDGNLWIGTVVAGAYRYDGNSFLWFPEKELSTLPDGRVPGVRSMLEDKDGYMWLSNWKSKYKIIEKDGEASYEKLEGIDMNIGPLADRLPYFNSGLRDRNGILWMTSYGGAVWKYDPSSEFRVAGNDLVYFPVKYGEDDALLISIYEDNNGLFWLGTDNAGVYTFDGENYKRFFPLGK